jgi:hypothetical protein
MTKEDRVHPFSNGSQFCDWEERNCLRCAKQIGEKAIRYKCVLQKAMHSAYWNDGTISKQEGDRIGFNLEANVYGWECPEREDPIPRERKPTKPKSDPNQQTIDLSIELE